MDDADSQFNRPNVCSRAFRSIGLHAGQTLRRPFQYYQVYLDKFTPYVTIRWVSTVLLGFLYMCRIIYCQGFYIVTYALGIYHLNLFIAFLTPKMDPQLDFESEDEEGSALPSRQTDEFRPFMRRLPEFKFWYSATKGILVAFVCTFFEVFNIPVFWPILVMYFIVLFMLTMKRQIRHMIKYRYIPFTHSKPRPGNTPRPTDVPQAAAPAMIPTGAHRGPGPAFKPKPKSPHERD